MAYRKKTFRFTNAVEIEEYHTGRYGAPGQSRLERRKPTPEQMQKVNQKNKEKTCRRKLRRHFQTEDYLAALTYIREKRPEDMQEAKKDFDRFIRIVRREYARRGETLKWIRNIEVGTKGAWHTHLVVNRIPDTDLILQRAWKHGRVHLQLLHEKGEFRDLAAYMTKSPDTDPRLKEVSYSASRNLPLPEPEEKLIIRWETWKEPPRIPQGFYLDRDSFWEGINPVTGYRCRHYTLLRLQRRQ